MALIARDAPTVTLPSAITSILLRVFIGGVLLFAAVGKLIDLSGFQRSLAANDWISTTLLLPAALFLIFAELMACVLLCHSRTLSSGIALSSVLSLTFTFYTAAKILIGVSADCACFGVFLKLPPWVMLATDLALCSACVALLRMRASAEADVNRTTDASEHSSRLRLPWLIGLLLLCTIGFLRALPYDPLLRFQLSTLLNLSKAEKLYDPVTPAMRKNDPGLFSQLPLPPLKGISPARPTFVVVLSNCSLCSLGGMSPAVELGQKYNSNVLLISPNPLPQMQTFAQEHRLHAQLFSDPGGRFQATYNANWRPGTYLLDATRRLLWKQNGMRPDFQEMQHAIQHECEEKRQ